MRLSARAPRRGFVWALAASLLLHGSFLALAPAHLGAPADEADTGESLPLAVRLAPPPAVPPRSGPPAVVVAPRAVVAAPVAAARPPAELPPATFAMPPAPPVPAAPAAGEPAAGEPPPAEAPPAAPVLADSGAIADPAAPPPATAAVRTEGDGAAQHRASRGAVDAPPPEAANATTAVAGDPPPGSITFPRSGRLEYAVTLGDPPSPIGRVVYAWEASETAYRLSLVAQTTGLAGLVRRVRVEQVSRGRLTPQGLQPEAYTMDRGPGARNEFARFDWAAKQITYGYPDAMQTGELAAGAQDALSLILQFAFVPIDEGRRDVLLTTGRRFYVQSYERVGEEVIETANGAWRAWHLRRVRARPDDEGYDMWLAIDRPYLPVRIRWTDRRGRTTSATVDTVRLARD